MAVVEIGGLGRGGVNTDIPTHELPSNIWTSCRNVRFNSGRAIKTGGSIDVFPPVPVPAEGRSTSPLAIYPDRDRWIWGSSSDIYLLDGLTHTLATRQDDTDEVVPYELQGGTWYYTSLSNCIVFSAETVIPQGLEVGSSTFIDLPDWDEDWRCDVMRSYKNYLLALNTTENGVEFPQRVRWSDIAPPNILPQSWDAADITKSAGFTDLTGAVGHIVDGAPLRNAFIIYTDQEVFAMDFVGGNNIFGFRKIFNDAGVIARDCVAEIDGMHYVMTGDDIYRHNGSTKQSIVTDRIKDFLRSQISKESAPRSKLIYSPTKRELWVCFDSQDSGSLNTAAIYNLNSDTWSFIDLPNILDINFGPSFADLIGSRWRDENEPWVEYGNLPWNFGEQDFLSNSMVGCSVDDNFYAIDEGELFKGVPLTSSLERLYLDFHDVGLNSQDMKRFTRAFPKVSGDGELLFQFGGSVRPEGEIRWGPFRRFQVGQDWKIDFRQTARYLSVRIQGQTANTWELTGLDFDIIAGGMR